VLAVAVSNSKAPAFAARHFERTVRSKVQSRGGFEMADSQAMQAPSILASPGLVTSVVLAAMAGALDTLGHIGYVHAATHGSMGVAAALVAVFPGIAVLLAALVFRERVTHAQLVGFARGIAGILFIVR